VEERPFEPGVGEDAEGIALADSQREQAVGELVDRLRRLCPGDLAPAVLLFDEISRARALLRDGALPERPDRAHGRIMWEEKGGPSTIRSPRAHDLERFNQLRPGQHPGRARA